MPSTSYISRLYNWLTRGTDGLTGVARPRPPAGRNGTSPHRPRPSTAPAAAAPRQPRRPQEQASAAACSAA
eukprot:1664864-Alexandrium_andersonii.AAC.1